MTQKVIILGATGLLGRNLVKSCVKKNIKFITVGRKNCNINLDLSEPSSFKNLSKIVDQAIVINATGFNSLEICEENFENCKQINTKIVKNFFEHKFLEILNLFKFLQINYTKERKTFQIKKTIKLRL